jgi:predicted nucleotidyltransferase
MLRVSRGDNFSSKEALSAYIESLKKRMRLKCVILFGSAARKSQGRRSDIDIMVVSDDLPEDLHKRLDILWEEKPALIDVLGFREAELFDILHRHFILKAIMEGKVVYGDGSIFKKRADAYIKRNRLVPYDFGYTHRE